MIEGLVLDIPTPPAFLPLLDGHRYQGAKGGRGGAKSHFFGAQSVEEMFTQHTRLACVREIQNSIKDSVKQLIEDKIYTLQAVDVDTGKQWPIAPWFKVTEREIVCRHTDSLAIFRGLQNHTAASIKSLEGFNRAWYEEAQTLTQRSLDLATPTFRDEGTQQRFSWNPEFATDPVDKMFREALAADDPDFVCVTVNYEDNPWFPKGLRADMERDKLRDADKYNWIWRGGYRQNSEAQVLRNWRIERFDAPPAGTKLLGGGDWGFSVDPTVGLICFVRGRTLYIWREIWALGCTIDRTPALFDRLDPEWTPERAKDPTWRSLARRIPIVMDGAWPQSVKYMQDHGFGNLTSAVKGAGSVEEGVTFLQSYDIVVHPDCIHAIDELKLYSYVVDKKTGLITTELEDKNNHTIDSARYAVEGVRRAVTSSHQELRL
jgi:phage terminase large subunit